MSPAAPMIRSSPRSTASTGRGSNAWAIAAYWWTNVSGPGRASSCSTPSPFASCSSAGTRASSSTARSHASRAGTAARAPASLEECGTGLTRPHS